MHLLEKVPGKVIDKGNKLMSDMAFLQRHLQEWETKLRLADFHCITNQSSTKTSMSPRLHKACIPSPSCKLLPPTAAAVACDASKWTLPFLTSKEALAPGTAAWEGGRGCTLTCEQHCWPCWPSWRLRENMHGGHITTRSEKEPEVMQNKIFPFKEEQPFFFLKSIAALSSQQLGLK